MKFLFILLGTVSLCLGVAGIFIPGLPATPFLLLTAGLYVKSSEKLYTKLMNNRITGPYIKEFRANKGMTKKAKVRALLVMWLMIIVSCLFFVPSVMVKVIVLGSGIIGSVVMGIIVPTISLNKTETIKTDDYGRKEKTDQCVGSSYR